MNEEQKQALKLFITQFMNDCETEELNYENYIRALDFYTFCNELLKMLN